MHRVAATDRLRRSLRQADVAEQSGVHQFRHRTHRLLDRRRRVDAMQVVEVYVIRGEVPQALLREGTHPGALAQSVGTAAAELGGDHYLLAASLHGTTD